MGKFLEAYGQPTAPTMTNGILEAMLATARHVGMVTKFLGDAPSAMLHRQAKRVETFALATLASRDAAAKRASKLRRLRRRAGYDAAKVVKR